MRKFVLVLLCVSCYIPPGEGPAEEPEMIEYEPLNIAPLDLPADFIKGMDISMLYAIEAAGGKYYNEDNAAQDLLVILKAHGLNWVRLRIWNKPTADSPGQNDLAVTLAIAKRAKDAGLKFLLDFHYSDTWADPGKQATPAEWQGLGYEALKTALYNYTLDTVQALVDGGAAPDLVQIGNEINGGMLFDIGNINEPHKHFEQLGGLLNAGAAAVREAAPNAQIMIHLAKGGSDLTWWFDQYAKHNGEPASIAEVDFDVIGLSWYPFYADHGKLSALKTQCAKLKDRYAKPVLVAETAYAWTLDYGDSTSNIFYTEEEEVAATLLDSAEYVTKAIRNGKPYVPASIENQAYVTRAVMQAVSEAGGSGVFYWAGEWIAVKGLGANNWENQAFFDFNGKTLPSLAVFE